MAPGSALPLDSFLSHATHMNNKDPASKRKRANRLAKLKQREQWLSHQVTDHMQGEKSLHADTDPCINDPGEVIHPKFTAAEPHLLMDSRVSWASLLNSSVSAATQQKPQKMHAIATVPMTEAEPDPELLHTNSSLHSHLCIKRPGQKDSSSVSSPSPKTNRYAFYECDADTDVSPKSCADRSPMSKSSKEGRGLRRSRSEHRNLKENECIVTAHKKEIKGQQRRFDGTQARSDRQDHRFCCTSETEDGWEAAADVLGLHSVPKRSSQATRRNDQRQLRTKSTSLMGMGSSKQPGLQRSVQGKAWMHGDLRRPSSLPKQQGARVHTCLKDQSDKPQCPICTEDLDSTDTSFDSCPCGFSLCLFCYHKIASENGICPGCRGVYVRDVSAETVVFLPR